MGQTNVHVCVKMSLNSDVQITGKLAAVGFYHLHSTMHFFFLPFIFFNLQMRCISNLDLLQGREFQLEKDIG